jgi:hypothetical protein
MDDRTENGASLRKVFTSEATNKYALTWGQRPGQGIFFCLNLQHRGGLMTDKKYLTEDEMLEYLEKIGIKKSRSWAKHARFKRRGPKFIKFGGHVRTTINNINEWIQSCVKE